VGCDGGMKTHVCDYKSVLDRSRLWHQWIRGVQPLLGLHWIGIMLLTYPEMTSLVRLVRRSTGW